MGSIYFALADGLNAVKIGFTENINSRLNYLRSSCPVKLLLCHTIPDAEEKDEHNLHNLYRPYRIHGEWYTLDGELYKFLKPFLPVEFKVFFKPPDKLAPRNYDAMLSAYDRLCKTLTWQRNTLLEIVFKRRRLRKIYQSKLKEKS